MGIKQYFDSIETLDWRHFDENTLFYLVRTDDDHYALKASNNANELRKLDMCYATRASEYWFIDLNEVSVCPQLFDKVNECDDDNNPIAFERLTSRALTHQDVIDYFRFNPNLITASRFANKTTMPQQLAPNKLEELGVSSEKIDALMRSTSRFNLQRQKYTSEKIAYLASLCAGAKDFGMLIEHLLPLLSMQFSNRDIEKVIAQASVGALGFVVTHQADLMRLGFTTSQITTVLCRPFGLEKLNFVLDSLPQFKDALTLETVLSLLESSKSVQDLEQIFQSAQMLIEKGFNLSLSLLNAFQSPSDLEILLEIMTSYSALKEDMNFTIENMAALLIKKEFDVLRAVITRREICLSLSLKAEHIVEIALSRDGCKKINYILENPSEFMQLTPGQIVSRARRNHFDNRTASSAEASQGFFSRGRKLFERVRNYVNQDTQELVVLQSQGFEANQLIPILAAPVGDYQNIAGLGALGFDEIQVFSMDSQNGRSNNPAVQQELLPALRGLGLDASHVVRMLSNIGGSSDLAALQEFLPALRALGFNASQVVSIVSRNDGSNNLATVQESLVALQELGFDTEQITEIVLANGFNIEAIMERRPR